MKIFVQVGCELDPELNLRVDRRSGEVKPEEGDRLFRVWPLGRAGISAALELPESEVVAFALGDEHDEALRHAVAAGAHQAYKLAFDEEQLPTKVLADWLREQSPDLVIADRLAGGLSWHLGWAHLSGLAGLRVEDGRLVAFQHMGKGNRYEVSAPLPVAVRLSSESLRLPYISRTRIRAVEMPCWEEVDLEVDPDVDSTEVEIGNLQPARARTRGAKKTKKKSKASDRVKALMGLCAPSSAPTPVAKQQDEQPEEQSPEGMAQEFIRYLKHHELINKEQSSVSVS